MDRQTADCTGVHTPTTVNLPTLVCLAHPTFKAPSSGLYRGSSYDEKNADLALREHQ